MDPDERQMMEWAIEAQTPANLGEQAGWDGLGPEHNPYTQTRSRQIWERRRKRGIRCRLRYLEVRATK